MDNYNLFVRDKDRWEEFLSSERKCEESPAVKEIKNGIILPAKKTGEAINGIYSGGVLNESGGFEAGFLRMREARKANFTCFGEYEYDESLLVTADETVIFGGMVIPIFGHFFTECLSRLWYVIESGDKNTKIAFLTLGDADFYDDFFELAGIDKDRIIYITAPTRFKTIIVPDQALYLRDCYTDKANVVYDEIRKNAPKKDCKKLYISRSKYGGTMIGEEFFEEFYKKLGYTVIYPETLPVKEQIAYAASAESIAATMGTLTHFVIFAKKGAHLTSLLRSDEIKAHNAQSVINGFKEVTSDIIDVNMNLLPVRHTTGVFLILPNKHFRDYLDFYKIPCREEELRCDIRDYTPEYYEKWLERYTDQRRYDHLISLDMSDVINTVSELIHDKSFPREQLDQSERRNKLIKHNQKLLELKERQKARNKELREENKELADKCARLSERLEASENSLREARAELNEAKMRMQQSSGKGLFKKRKK